MGTETGIRTKEARVALRTALFHKTRERKEDKERRASQKNSFPPFCRSLSKQQETRDIAKTFFFTSSGIFPGCAVMVVFRLSWCRRMPVLPLSVLQ